MLVCAAMLTCARAADLQPRARSFHFEYKAILKDVPEGAKHLDVWIPVPHEDSYQQIAKLAVVSPYPFTIAAAADGNTILHVGLDQPKQGAFSITLTFDAVRQEHIQPLASNKTAGTREEDSAALAQYLKADRLVPIDDQIRSWALDVAAKANARTDLEKARAIYNHVVATVKYDKSGKGWGRGDIYYACEERRGNCTDFHAIVIGYARALGIPARFAIGFPLPVERGEGRIAGYHCWAELYIKGTGWVPVDASEAAKNPSKREYFFGAHDENRIEFTKGRDVELVPKQHGDRLNYFVYPYAEIDGEPFAGAAIEATYKDTALIR